MAKGRWTGLDLPKGAWMANDNEPRVRRQTPDEWVDDRSRRLKRLRDCPLPEGFRLVTPQVRQVVMGGQMRWAFVLAWRAGRPLPGLAAGTSLYYTARYEAQIADEVQMRWAVEDFSRELREAGYDPGDVRGCVPERYEQMPRWKPAKLVARSKLAGLPLVG